MNEISKGRGYIYYSIKLIWILYTDFALTYGNGLDNDTVLTFGISMSNTS